jgi:glyoxylase-like metal-dependent hydrolase (beta-lactamase superfamily II)
MSIEAARPGGEPGSPAASPGAGDAAGLAPGSAANGTPAIRDAITELGHDVFQIDTRMAGYEGITAGYLIRAGRPCLVETGTGPSAPVVREALAALGVGASELATVVVTHIHLDHAGGTGDIAKMFPHAEVVVHERGARHLVDPSRLMSSARMVYGDELDGLFGELAPTPADRIRAVEQTGTIDLGGGRRLDSHYSPGHAKHHVGLLDSESGDLYVGDAAGVYIPETADLRPATPPPDFDLETALKSLRMFASLRPDRLLFSHFGPVTGVGEALERSAEELRVWVDEVSRARGSGLDLDHAVAMVRERTNARYAVFKPDTDPAIAAKFEQFTGAASNVAGIMHWLDRSAARTT